MYVQGQDRHGYLDALALSSVLGAVVLASLSCLGFSVCLSFFAAPLSPLFLSQALAIVEQSTAEVTAANNPFAITVFINDLQLV